MRYGSVCSGIEAATVAWERLGWEAAWYAEIEAFPSAVLAHHYPDVPNLGDMTTLPQRILSGEMEAPDILVGGTPCQAFSVAGLRASMQDERGQLTIKFLEIADAIDTVRLIHGRPPCIVIWENVPGALSTKDNAFGCLLGGLVGESKDLQPTGNRWINAGLVLGPNRQAAWRILNAQFFGVPQRRRRIFLVSSARTDIDCGKILFEQKGVPGNFAPGASEKQKVAANVANGFDTASTVGVAKCLTTRVGQSYDSEMETFVVHGTQDPCVSNKDYALGRNGGQENVVAIAGNIIGRGITAGGNGVGADDSGVCYTLTTADRHAVAYSIPSIQSGLMVRRLLPIECERLQGFPDNYTKIPWRNKAAADCPDAGRYKALGNSMAVPVMHWIGERINANT